MRMSTLYTYCAKVELLFFFPFFFSFTSFESNKRCKGASPYCTLCAVRPILAVLPILVPGSCLVFIIELGSFSRHWINLYTIYQFLFHLKSNNTICGSLWNIITIILMHNFLCVAKLLKSFTTVSSREA